MNSWAESVVGEVLLTGEQISEAAKRMGAQISEDYRDKDLLVVGVLRGAFMFLADLIRHIELPIVLDFMSVSSYGIETKSSGVVRIIKDLSVPVKGKHVLMVEDVVDTGLTLEYLKQVLQAGQPESVKVCSLLDKPGARKRDVKVDYVGFSIGNEFVVGYGLDWKEKYRNLPYVMIPKELTNLQE